MLDSSLQLALSTATWPWHLALRWVAWCSSLLLTSLAWLGAVPRGFVTAAKVCSCACASACSNKRPNTHRLHAIHMFTPPT